MAPPNLPVSILARLEAVTTQALALPRVTDTCATSGFTASPMPNAQFQPFLAGEIALWNSVIDTAKIERES